MAVDDVRGTTGPQPPGNDRIIRVEIGELVLDGFSAAHAERVAGAFSAELTRLVREHGVPVATDGTQRLDLLSGLPPLPATTSSRRLGEALARSVHAGLSGHGEREGRQR